MEALAMFFPIALGIAFIWIAILIASIVVSFFERIFNVKQYDEMVEKW